MKFGEVKTIVENNLIDSVKDKSIFKENIKNFKKHFLKDPNLSKLYLIYDDLLKPRGLNEEEANSTFFNDLYKLDLTSFKWSIVNLKGKREVKQKIKKKRQTE